MEPGPVCRLGSRPRMLICYLCGREYGSKSLSVHIPQCQKKWLMEEEQKPKNERRQLPPQPNAGKAIGISSARAFENFNVEAYAAYEQTLEQCSYCQRRFLPKPFRTHQKACTAAKPAKPAGTGLIKNSLTNRLVPGAVAGSMHGKAKKQPLPLSLLRPPPKAKPKLRSTQRPAWTGGGGSQFDETEDNQLPTVRHKTSAQEWCLQAETSFSSKPGSNLISGQSSHKNSRLPDSSNSFQSRNRPPFDGGDHSRLVNTFGDLWRTHRGDKNLPTAPQTRIAHNKQGGKEWFIPVVETTTSSQHEKRSAKNAVFGGSKTMSHGECRSAVAVRSSRLEFPRERALGFGGPGKTVRESKQGAASVGEAGERGQRTHHRRSPAFY